MRFPSFKKREGGAVRTKDGGLWARFPEGQERKGKHKHSTRETETRSSPCTETCRTGKRGGICPAHAWQVNTTKHRVLPAHSDILSLCQLWRRKSAFMFCIGGLQGCSTGDSFLRAEYIRFRKFLGPGDTCGKNFLSLADREPNPFSLNLDSLPLLGSLTYPWVLENFAAFSQSPAECSSTLSPGAGGRQGAAKLINTLSRLPCARYSPIDALNILVCPKKWEQN